MKNIILITIDCLRKDHISSEIAPNIYNLMEEGLSFEDVITHSSHTSIAFASMFGSVFGRKLERVLPAVLNDYGYTTLAISAQPQMYERFLSKVREDFQFWNALNPTAINIVRTFRGTHIAYKLRTGKYYRIYEIGRRLYKRLQQFISHCYIKGEEKPIWANARHINQRVYDLLDAGKIKNPFFLWLHYLDPHWRYQPPQEYVPSDMSREEVRELNTRYRKTQGRVTSKEFELMRELYKGEIRYLDYRVGQLLQYFKKEGLLDETIIIVTADHGEEFFDHGGTQHSIQLYDEVVNVPFIVHGHEKKGKIKGQRGHINLAPTILDLLGLPEEESFLGKSMFKGSDKEIVMKTVRGKLGIRTEQWKYISPGEMYNLKEDPKEKMNVAEKHPELVREFEEKLEPYKGEEYEEEEKVEDEEVKGRLRELGYLD